MFMYSFMHALCRIKVYLNSHILVSWLPYIIFHSYLYQQTSHAAPNLVSEKKKKKKTKKKSKTRDSSVRRLHVGSGPNMND